MRFLLDENLSRSLEEFLRNEGHEVYRVGTHVRAGISDEEVLREAINRNAVLITKNLGQFGELIFRRGIRPPGLICVKNFLERGLHFEGYITVVEKRGGSVRHRRRPL